VGSLLWVILAADLQPLRLAHDAVLLVMLIYLMIHSGLLPILTAMQARAGLPYEPVVLRPFWVYSLGIFWASCAAFLLLPVSWGGA
jgi:cytochrome c oxidase subunit I+III